MSSALAARQQEVAMCANDPSAHWEDLGNAQARADAASEGVICLLAERRRAWRVASMAGSSDEATRSKGDGASSRPDSTKSQVARFSLCCFTDGFY